MTTSLSKPRQRVLSVLSALCILALSSNASAQTGVDDDRVSLPEGPGSLEGVGDNVEIDPNMASMRYSIPLIIPQGRLGMSPDVSLSYSSSGAAGVVGVGWSVPMPSIDRMTSRGVPAYDNEDQFAFDGGDELVWTGSDDQDQVYRARFEKSFRRHTWVDIGDGSGGYWKVEYPDGKTSYYGATSAGQPVDSARLTDAQGNVASYKLVETVDVYGNRIAYTWDKFDSNIPLLSEISYVFDDNARPLYTIRYAYETRPDPISDANTGFETLLNRRMVAMTFLTENEIIREYLLTYEAAATSGGLSRLEDVRQYGLGGEAGGVLNPIRFAFEYQRGLGVECTGNDCDKPYLVNMGSAGVALSSGRATLIDINGDALPDILDTSQVGNHRFVLNTLTANADGSFSHGFGDTITSAITQSSSFTLGGNIQTLDVNGDGFSDLLNTSTGAFLLKDPANDDWIAPGSALDTTALMNLDFANARFFDHDNDKKIDVLVSTGMSTQLVVNEGDAFTTTSAGVDDIGVSFASGALQMSDINGDGMTDPVEVIVGSNTLRYRVNLGRGKFSAWRNMSNFSIAAAEQELMDLEDLNGDGRDDVVIVTSTEIKYALNRGDRFDDYVVITDIDGGSFPERGMNVTVLYADMNANGSEDVVWFDTSGQVQYVELFPQRPNLLSHTDNGIGFVQKITYGTATEQAAIAARDGNPWQGKLQIPMPVVTQTDNFVTLTGGEDGSGLHDVVRYTYRDGFYDGVEKQYRGFGEVFTSLQGSDSQEPGVRVQTFDLGREDVYMNGLSLTTATFSDERELEVRSNSYARCPLDASVPGAETLEGQGRFPVIFVCKTSEEAILKEGQDMGSWITTQKNFEYDVFGNIAKSEDLGVVGVDGDEMTTETTFATPGSAWLLNLPIVEQTYDNPGGATAEMRYYYDGDNFDGVTEDISLGFLSRKTTAANDTTVLETMRQKRDQYGNVIETLDPNGDPGDSDRHRRVYTMDTYGLFVVNSKILNTTPSGDAYTLERDSLYDYRFQKVSSLDNWVVVQDGQQLTPTNITSISYDELGREDARQMPGDEDATPTVTVDYALGDPFSKITIKTRSERNGSADLEQVKCLDGRGKLYQERTRISNNRYLVTGFTVYNSREAEVAVYQPYESDSAECEVGEPSGVGATRTRYDALFRPLEKTLPDEAIYGTASVERYEYEPLVEIFYDAEDTVEGGEHEDTPLYRRRDGMGRVVELQRSFSDAGSLETASYNLFYDNTGSFTGYEDPAGNRHELEVDWAGRVTRITNPNLGTTTMTYDAASNMLERTDARGVTSVHTYDGINRLREVYDSAAADETRITYHYDFIGDCDQLECTQPASRLVQIDFPLGDASTGSRRYGYDNRGNTIFEALRYDALDLAMRVSYDNQERAASVTYPDGTIIEYAYDGAGRPSRLAGFVDALDYNPNGQLSSLNYANGATSTLAYDAMLRVSSVEHMAFGDQVIERYAITRDRLGSLLTLVDSSEREDIPSATLALGYDDWYRLVQVETTAAEGSAEQLTYAYDLIDNVTDLSSSLANASPAHVGAIAYAGAGPNQVTQAGALAYAYDAQGQMTQRGDVAFAWDYQQRMTDAGDAQYLYGADHIQLGELSGDKVVIRLGPDFEVRDGVSYSYARAMGTRLGRASSMELMTAVYPDVVEDDEINVADAFALETGANAAAPYAATATTERLLGAAAARLLQEEEDVTAYLHSDHLGSIVAATDDSGAVRGQRSYYPTGTTRWEEGAVDFYGFTGQEHMDSGLVRFEYRHLDPTIGRWTSFDPAFFVLEAASMDKLGEATTGYAYVANNFATLTDPLGLVTEEGTTTSSGNDDNKTTTTTSDDEVDDLDNLIEEAEKELGTIDVDNLEITMNNTTSTGGLNNSNLVSSYTNSTRDQRGDSIGKLPGISHTGKNETTLASGNKYEFTITKSEPKVKTPLSFSKGAGLATLGVLTATAALATILYFTVPDVQSGIDNGLDFKNSKGGIQR